MAGRKQGGGGCDGLSLVSHPGLRGMLHPYSVHFLQSFLVAGRSDLTFNPWTGDPLPRKGEGSCGQRARLTWPFMCFYCRLCVFPGRMEAFRPGASVIQGEETGPHPGKGAGQYQEAHLAVARTSCWRPSGQWAVGSEQGAVAGLPAWSVTVAGGQCSGSIQPACGSPCSAWQTPHPSDPGMAVGTCLMDAEVEDELLSG